MMRYLVLLKAAQPSEPPPPGLMEAIMALGREATTAGALLDTAGLAPSAAAARVRLAGGELSVTDGPFTEAKEFISYALYQVKSREEATSWAARLLAIHLERWPGWEGDAEVLRVLGPEDFADAAGAS
jgi:hypothetical protein